MYFLRLHGRHRCGLCFVRSWVIPPSGSLAAGLDARMNPFVHFAFDPRNSRRAQRYRGGEFIAADFVVEGGSGKSGALFHLRAADQTGLVSVLMDCCGHCHNSGAGFGLVGKV